MAASAIWTVHCSTVYAGRANNCRWWVGECDTQKEADRMARQAGWRVDSRADGNINRCPECLEYDKG